MTKNMEDRAQATSFKDQSVVNMQDSQQPDATLETNKMCLEYAQWSATKLNGPVRHVKDQSRFLESCRSEEEAIANPYKGHTSESPSDKDTEGVPALRLEGNTWWERAITKPLAEAGQLFYIGLIPGIGPVLCYYLSYRHVYIPLRSLQIGGEDQQKLRNRMMSNMLKDLAVGLFLPVVGSFVNRYRQGNHRSVLFAAELSNERQDQPCQAYILSLDDSRPPIHLPIGSTFPIACQNDATDDCEIGWIPEESPLTTAIHLHNSVRVSMLGPGSSNPCNQDISMHRNHKCALGFEVCIAEGCCGAVCSGFGSLSLDQNQKVEVPPIVTSPTTFKEDGLRNAATTDSDRHELPALAPALNDLTINEDSPSRQVLVAGTNEGHATAPFPLSRSAAYTNLQALCATPTLEFGISSSRIALVDPPLPHSVNLIADPHRHMSQAVCVVTEDPEVISLASVHEVNESSRGKDTGLYNKKDCRNLAQAPKQDRSKSVPDSQSIRKQRVAVSVGGNIEIHEPTTSVTPPPHHGEKHDGQRRSHQAHGRPNTHAAPDGDGPSRRVRNALLEGGASTEPPTTATVHGESQSVVDDLLGLPLGPPRGRVSRNTVTLAKAVRRRPKGYFEM